MLYVLVCLIIVGICHSHVSESVTCQLLECRNVADIFISKNR